MSSLMRNIIIWVALGSLAIYIFNNINGPSSTETISYDQFQQEVLSNRVSSVTYEADQATINGILEGGSRFTTTKQMYTSDPYVQEALKENKVEVVRSEEHTSELQSQD